MCVCVCVHLLETDRQRKNVLFVYRSIVFYVFKQMTVQCRFSHEALCIQHGVPHNMIVCYCVNRVGVTSH